MKALEIVTKIKAEVERRLQSRGLEIIDIEYKREPVGMVLRFFIDHPDGIDLNRCAEASEIISEALDKSGILKNSYTLEVSSPGVERRLTKPEHFERFIGSKVTIRTRSARDGRKKFTGVVTGADGNGVSLKIGDETFEFSYKEVAAANLIYSDERGQNV